MTKSPALSEEEIHTAIEEGMMLAESNAAMLNMKVDQIDLDAFFKRKYYSLSFNSENNVLEDDDDDGNDNSGSDLENDENDIEENSSSRKNDPNFLNVLLDSTEAPADSHIEPNLIYFDAEFSDEISHTSILEVILKGETKIIRKSQLVHML